jgi:hypothetical protein
MSENGDTQKNSPDPVDLQNLNEEQQKIFNTAYGKGAAKVEERLKALEAQHTDLLRKASSAESLAKMTQEDRDRIAAQLHTIEEQGMTSEQRFTKQLTDTRNDYENKLKVTQAQAEGWRAQHHSMIVDTALTQEAMAADAFLPAQVVALLRPMVEVEEIIEEGRPPRFVPKINTQDKDGKPIKVDLRQGVVDFLTQNANLVKSKVVRGIEGTVEALTAEDGTVISREQLSDPDFVNDPKNWKIISQALSSGKLHVRG